MAKYIFRLEGMHVDFQRGKEPDMDTVTFGILVGPQDRGHVGRYIDRRIQSGDTVLFSDFPPDKPPGKWGTWEIGPTEVGPNDIVQVACTAVNTSDNGPSLSPGDQVKIAIASWSAITGIAIAITTGAETAGIGAIAGAVVSGIGAVLGEIAGDLTPTPPKCNGLVFADIVSLTGTELADQTNNAAETFSVTSQPLTDGQSHPDDCGHVAQTVVTFSVTSVPFESVRHFLGSKGDLSQGIKKALSLSDPVISVRSLIES